MKRNFKRILTATAAAALSVLVLAGCDDDRAANFTQGIGNGNKTSVWSSEMLDASANTGAGIGTGSNTVSGDAGNTAGTNNNTGANAGTDIGLDRAKEIAYAEAGVSEADAVRKDYSFEHGVYDIDFSANGIEYDYEILASTGEIIKANREYDDDYYHYNNGAGNGNGAAGTGNTGTNAGTDIGLDRAKEIAYTAAGVSEADTTERSYSLEHGVYDIEFTANRVEYDYEILASTGEIIKANREYD